MRSLKISVLLLSISTLPVMPTTTKSATDVFDRWMVAQRKIAPQDLTQLGNRFGEHNLKNFRDTLSSNGHLLRSLKPLLQHVTRGSITQQGHHLEPSSLPKLQEGIGHFFSLLQNDPAAFIEELKRCGLASPELLALEASSHHNETVEKYRALFKLLLAQKSVLQEENYLVSIGNHLAQYCYGEQAFSQYQQLLMDSTCHGIVRMLHATIWHCLVGGNSWTRYHADCLTQLKREADHGKRVVYIAGGNDVYMLLANGIYNITIIDPFLPSQTRYYAGPVNWFLVGEIGDEIIGQFGEQELVLRRESIDEGESFVAKTGGQFKSLRKFTTTWGVYTLEEKSLGSLIIEHRPAVQSDFALKADSVLLMSYDEAIYASLPNFMDGWGISPKSIDPLQRIYIKQLSKPIDKKFLSHLRVASVVNYLDIKFINLASDPN